MKVCYVIGNDNSGKTTLISIMAYNLFLRNYQVGIVDLTDRGKGYFFRFGTCDFFALGDGSANIPQKLQVTLQDVEKMMRHQPENCLYKLPLWPGLKICITNPAPREKKIILAGDFLSIFQDSFDVVFVEMTPPLHLLLPEGIKHQDRVLVICTDAREDWPSKDKQLMSVKSKMPQQVKVMLNKQVDRIIAATRFVEINSLGVDYILDPADEVLANSTVMEMCKQFAGSSFLRQLAQIIHSI